MLVKTTGPKDSKMFFLGEAPGEVEDQTGLPFQNPHGAGKIFNLIMSQVGINRRDVRIRNVALQRPPNNDMSHFFYDKRCTVPKPELVQWIEELRQELEESRPNVVVALGHYALWALTGEKKISTARGYITESTLVPGLKVLPTYHPQNINYEWKNFPIAVFDVRKALFHSDKPKIALDKTRYIAPATFTMFMDYLETIRKGNKRFSFDIEAHVGTAYPYLLGVADSPNFGMSFYNMKGSDPTISYHQEAQLWHKLAEVGKACEVIMHNVCYDKAVMWHHHQILFENIWMDTLIAAHVIWPEFPRDLGFLGSILLDVPRWKNLSTTDTAIYCALDAIRTFAIAEPLAEELKKQKMQKTYDFEMNMIDPAIVMQLRGVKCDLSRRKDLLEGNKEKNINGLYNDLTANKAILDQQFGRDINFNSPKQVQQLLYYDMGLEPQFRRRKTVEHTRIMTVDAKAMKRLARKYPDHEWLAKILEYKKLLKLKTFLEAETSPEGRFHTSYNITGSATEEEGRKSFGRWSSSASIILPYGPGNLQNIPPAARFIFRADEGKIWVRGDMKQAEAVIVAFASGDARLQQFFRKSFAATTAEEQAKYDVHKLTASLMFGIPYDEITPEMRRIGKTLRHACTYFAGPQVIADQLGIDFKDAKQFFLLFHQANPLIKVWYNSIQHELQTTRCLVTPLGRKHRFLERWSDSLFRSAYSYIPQSTVGDFLNESLYILYEKYGDKLDIMMQLHDALYVQCDDNRRAVERTKEIMHECMVRPIKMGFEEFVIEVDFQTGYIWGELDDKDDFADLMDDDYE
jgi:uracil-DNA glycosylase family 4